MTATTPPYRTSAVEDYQTVGTAGNTSIEFAVRWPDGVIEECRDEQRALDVASLYASRGAVLVSRTITYGDWTAPPCGRCGKGHSGDHGWDCLDGKRP